MSNRKAEFNCWERSDDGRLKRTTSDMAPPYNRPSAPLGEAHVMSVTAVTYLYGRATLSDVTPEETTASFSQRVRAALNAPPFAIIKCNQIDIAPFRTVSEAGIKNGSSVVVDFNMRGD